MLRIRQLLRPLCLMQMRTMQRRWLLLQMRSRMPKKRKLPPSTLTIPGNITFGASETTGEATVWQAYGITFSEGSSVKKIVLDLGGNTLTFAGTTVDKESSATVGATYKITGEGSVIFSNGTIEFTAFTKDQNTFAFNANTTELVFDNITATVKGL